MHARTFATDDLGHLTEIQLIHRLNNALLAREQTGLPVSRATRFIRYLSVRHPMVLHGIAIAVELRDAMQGSLLAMSLASEERLVTWAIESRARMDALLADIAILRMMREMERRIPALGVAMDGQRPVASR
jgi:hypothetical protein